MGKIETRKAGGSDGLSVRKAAFSAAEAEFKSTGGNSVANARGARSSNASLGIDADVAAGISNAKSGGPGAPMNTNVGSSQRAASLDDNYGGQDYSSRKGTQGSREDMTIGPKANRGEFGTSAKSGGHVEGGAAEIYGGAAGRPKGTAVNEKGAVAGRGGSMELARLGLSGKDGTGTAHQAPGAMVKDMAKSRAGMHRGGGDA